MLFGLLLLLPMPTEAAPSIGTLESIDDTGTMTGWAVDPDNPLISLDIHVYMDGGSFIGYTKADYPRLDVNLAGFPGSHGFHYPLPPVARDGAAHTFYVYVIDTSGQGADNSLLSGSPKTVILASTRIYLDNGTIRVGLEPRCGGTIAEIRVSNGLNLVNNFDCTGRQIQVAFYDGAGQYDDCSGCTFWDWNPVQGGDRFGMGSLLLNLSTSSSIIYIKTQPYQWNPSDKGGGAGRPVLSEVIVEQWVSLVPDQPYAIKVHSKATYLGSNSYTVSFQEFPAVAVNVGFDNFIRYSGTSPWTAEPVTESSIDTGRTVYTPEQWAGFVDNDGNGLTVFVPGQYSYAIPARGFGNISSGPGAEFAQSYNYFHPLTVFSFTPGSVLEGDIYLIAGNYQTARRLIYQLHDTLPAVDPFPPLGHLDSPLVNATLSGTVPVYGWAFDNVAVDRIEVYVDGLLDGNATYGTSRPDVAAIYPNISADVGYAYSLNTAKYVDGAHAIVVKAYDTNGNNSILGQAVVTFGKKVLFPSVAIFSNAMSPP